MSDAQEEERFLSITLSASEFAKLDLSAIQLFKSDHISQQLAFNNLHEDLVTANTLLKSKGVIDAERSHSAKEENQDRNEKFKGLQNYKKDHHCCNDLIDIKENERSGDDENIKEFIRADVKENNEDLMSADVQKKNQECGGLMGASIDLASSQASRFLGQARPWEMQPSPITPFTPAAIPFKWEEVPGKPKRSDRYFPIPTSTPVLHPPPRLSKTHKPKQNNETQSNHSHSRSSSECEEKQVISVSEKQVISVSEEKPKEINQHQDQIQKYQQNVEKEDNKNSAGWMISSLEYKLPPSSQISTYMSPLFSPFRGLGPPEHQSRSSIFLWKKKKKQPKNTSMTDNLPYFAEKKGLYVEKKGNNTKQSFNHRIAAAMGAHDEDISSKKHVDPSKINRGFSPAFVHSRKPHHHRRRKVILRRFRRSALYLNALWKRMWRRIWSRNSRGRIINGSISIPYEELSH